jgi:hypothetical protein
MTRVQPSLYRALPEKERKEMKDPWLPSHLHVERENPVLLSAIGT